jgi:hypothetical protein
VIQWQIGLVLAGALTASLLAGCSSAPNILSSDAGWFSKPLTTFATPEWGVPAGQPRKLSERAVEPNDLLSAEGACAAAAPTAVASTDGAAGTPETALPSGGGIALDMTECEVVNRAGTPERFEIGSEGNRRTVVLTYLRGERSGIYRFVSGRLISVERAPEAPAPARPQRPARRGAA